MAIYSSGRGKMIGIRIFNLCSQKSTVITRNVFALSCRKSPKFFLSSLYPKFSASSTVVPQGMCIHSSRRFASDQASKQPKKQEGTGVSNTVDTPPHHPHTNTILQRLHDLEESFRVRGHSVLRWGLSALIVAGIIIYIFREPLRENVADEVADVASRSLADENVILKANEVTRAVLQDVLCDPEITKLASAFVMHVLHRDDVRAAAIQLTQHVLSDPSTLRKIVELAKTALSDLTAHEETRKLMLSYVKALILDQNTKDACKILLEELVNDPDVKGFMAASLGDLVTSSVVKSSAAELGKSVTHQVVNDAEIQQETGNFLWRALKKTFTPGWFG